MKTPLTRDEEYRLVRRIATGEMCRCGDCYCCEEYLKYLIALAQQLIEEEKGEP